MVTYEVVKRDGKVADFKGDSTFENCQSLTTLDFERIEGWIDYEAFSGCTSLKEINLGNIKYICQKAFFNCTSLTSVTVESFADDAYIEPYAFANCPKLKSFTINSENVRTSGYSLGYYNITEENYSNPDEYKKVDGFTIYAPKYSKAQEYANENGFAFEAIS